MNEARAEQPTKAQRELLVWLVKTEQRRLTQRGGYKAPMTSDTVEFRGGDLIDYYAEKAAARHAAWDAGDRSQDRGYQGSGGYASHGWRRAGGTALANLAKRGFLRPTSVHWGTQLYVLTDAGRAVVTAPQVRPLARLGYGRWRSSDGRWTFLRHESDPTPKRWFIYLDDEDEPINVGGGETTLEQVVAWVEDNSKEVLDENAQDF